jgi:hypothetical protein
MVEQQAEVLQVKQLSRWRTGFPIERMSLGQDNTKGLVFLIPGAESQSFIIEVKKHLFVQRWLSLTRLQAQGEKVKDKWTESTPH